MGRYGTSVNMDFGTTLVFKKDYRVNEFLSFEKGDKVRVANYVHKYYVELWHKQVSDLVKMKVEHIDEYLEEEQPTPFERLNGFADEYPEEFSHFVGGIAEAINLKKRIEQLEVWERFPAYLIDNHEGETLCEENLQQWLSDMLRANVAPARPSSLQAPDRMLKFNRDMVEAWKEGRKTNARCPVKPACKQFVRLSKGYRVYSVAHFNDAESLIYCPYGKIGDIIPVYDDAEVPTAIGYAKILDTNIEQLDGMSAEDCFAEGLNPHTATEYDDVFEAFAKEIWEPIYAGTEYSVNNKPYVWNLKLEKILHLDHRKEVYCE